MQFAKHYKYCISEHIHSVECFTRKPGMCSLHIVRRPKFFSLHSLVNGSNEYLAIAFFKLRMQLKWSTRWAIPWNYFLHLYSMNTIHDTQDYNASTISFNKAGHYEFSTVQSSNQSHGVIVTNEASDSLSFIWWWKIIIFRFISISSSLMLTRTFNNH